MPLPNYRELEELDAEGIRRLLDPNYDRSEVNRIAAERSLGGGGFSGARQNRLQESELMQRQLAGHQMLTPYLQMEQQRNLQTQGELAAMARQNEADKQLFERLRFSTNANDQQQARDIAERIRSQTAQLAASAESQRLSEQGALSRQAISEQGQNTRQATGIEAQLRLARESAGVPRVQSAWNDRGSFSTSGGNPVSPTRLPTGGGQERPSGPNSATMNEVYRLTQGFGNASPNLANGGTLGATMPRNNYGETGIAPGWGGNQLAQRSNLVPSFGNYQSEGGKGNVVSTPDYYGNVESEPQSVWQSGSNPEELVWGGVDSAVNSSRNWVDNSAYQFDPSLYA